LFCVKKKDEYKALKLGHTILLTMFKDPSLNLSSLKHLLPSVQMVLQECTGIFPKETPTGLPPMRGIEHKFDLVSGAPLPNRPAYHCKPEETKEIQRQGKLSKKLAKWVEYVESFPYMIPYKQRNHHIEAYALRRRYMIMISLQIKQIGFSFICELNEHFEETFKCLTNLFERYFLFESYLFREDKL